MQGASAGTQTCGGSGGQPSEFNDLVSLPILIKVISATMRPTVAITIPEVDEMMARAQTESRGDQRSKAESRRTETHRRGGVCSECTEV